MNKDLEQTELKSSYNSIKTELNDDAISRQAAIDAMATWDWQELYLPIHFKQLLEDLPSVSTEKTGRWIPVSERLPEIHQDALLSLRSLDIVVGFRAETEPYFYCYCADSCYIESQNVLAWMPLPEPYKGGEQDG